MIQSSLDFIEDIKDIDQGNLDSLFILSGFPDFPSTFVSIGIEHNLSPEAQIILADIDFAVGELGGVEDLEDFLDEMDNVIYDATTLNDEVEERAISCGAITAKYSAQYWYNETNYSKWYELVCEENIIKNPKGGNTILLSKKQKVLLVTDAIAAVEGAISGGCAGSWLGPWGAVAGAMLGAMCHGSAATGTAACIDKICE